MINLCDRRRIVGVSTPEFRMHGAFADGLINAATLVSAVAPLAEGPAWFDRPYRREAGLMKVILVPDQ